MPVSIQRMLFSSAIPSLPTQQRAQELIEPLLPNIAGAFEGAFNEFQSGVMSETRAKLYPGVRGQFVTNLVWEHVRDNLTDLDVEFCDRLGFFKVVLGDEIVIRFKRLNSELLAASEGTEQAMKWFSNQPLAGISDRWLRVNFGYRPEHNWLSCEDFYLTHQTGFSILGWASELSVQVQELGTPASGSGLPQVQITPINPPIVNATAQQTRGENRGS